MWTKPVPQLRLSVSTVLRELSTFLFFFLQCRMYKFLKHEEHSFQYTDLLLHTPLIALVILQIAHNLLLFKECAALRYLITLLTRD